MEGFIKQFSGKIRRMMAKRENGLKEPIDRIIENSKLLMGKWFSIMVDKMNRMMPISEMQTKLR